MTEYEIAATMEENNIGIGQWRSFVQCFKTFTELEREALCVSEASWRRLGLDFGKITSGTVPYRKTDGKQIENVQWWTMDAVPEL